MKNSFGLVQKIIRLYTFNTPIKKGKYRLATIGNSLIKDFPEEMLAVTNDGRKLVINPAGYSYPFLYFLGEYEPATTFFIRNIIKEGDVCLDIGANIGWYTTLLQTLVGKKGKVFAFEPVPKIFKLLEKSVKLNYNSANVTLNNIALGDEEKDIKLYLFKDMPDGHASISTLENKDYDSFSNKMITLDSYLEANHIENVNFVKADIEGAELMMLKGAAKLFEQEIPPIFEMEMVLGTAKYFGYKPNDLINYIKGKRDYDFYVIDEPFKVLTKIENFSPESLGANVLAIPKGFYKNRLANLKIKG